MRPLWLVSAPSSCPLAPTAVGGPSSADAAPSGAPGACGNTSSITRRTGPSAGIRSIASSASLVGVLTSTPPSTAYRDRSRSPSVHEATPAMSTGPPPLTGTREGSNANGNDADERAASAIRGMSRSSSVGAKSSRGRSCAVSPAGLAHPYGSRRNEKLPWWLDWTRASPRSS